MLLFKHDHIKLEITMNPDLDKFGKNLNFFGKCHRKSNRQHGKRIKKLHLKSLKKSFRDSVNSKNKKIGY